MHRFPPGSFPNPADTFNGGSTRSPLLAVAKPRQRRLRAGRRRLLDPSPPAAGGFGALSKREVVRGRPVPERNAPRTRCLDLRSKHAGGAARPFVRHLRVARNHILVGSAGITSRASRSRPLKIRLRAAIADRFECGHFIQRSASRLRTTRTLELALDLMRAPYLDADCPERVPNFAWHVRYQIPILARPRRPLITWSRDSATDTLAIASPYRHLRPKRCVLVSESARG